MNRISTQSFALAVVTCLIGLGCGSSKDPSTQETQVSGVAASESSATAVSLKDSSSPAVLRTGSPDGSGRFNFDTTGLSPPFFLKAETSSGTEYSVASSAGKADVNTVTSAACAGASSREDAKDCEEGWSGHDRGPHDNFDKVLKSLRTVLKPLFDLYGIRHIDADDDDSASLRKLLHDVSFVVNNGIVTVTNRATGGVIFVGPLRHLSEGTFYPQNMPPGPGGVTTCTSFTYSAYGACQPNNTQVRTVLTSSPAGCTGGTPAALTQACTYVPPCTLAVAVASCSTCHGSGGLPYPASHGGRPLTCANCHGPVNNGAGTPSVGMSAALSGGTCVLGYPTNSGTHRDGTVNFGAAQ